MKETNDQSNQQQKENTIDILVTPSKKSTPSSAPAEKKTAPAPKRPVNEPAAVKRITPSRPSAEKAQAKPAAPKRPVVERSAVRPTFSKESGGQRASETRKIGAAAATASRVSAAAQTRAGAPVPPAASPVGKKPSVGKFGVSKKAAKGDGKKKKSSEEKGERTPLASTLIIALIYIGVVVGISAVLSICGIRWANDIFALAKDEVVATVTIPENATVSEVSTLLKEAKIIKYPGVFRFYVNFKNRKADPPLAFKPGAYELRSTMNFDQIVNLIKVRKARGIVTLTIPEGYTVDQIIDLFVSHGMGTREGFVKAINEYDYKNYTFMEKLKSIQLSPDRKYRLEGYLFPDTYDFYADSGEIAIIDKMLSAFDSRFEKDYYARLDELGMNVDQVVTIASIIQKEGKFSTDFYPIAGVFYNRLNKKMRLDSDATVLYALPEHKAELTDADLNVDSSYNTRRHQGLPPSAIANPGWDAIQAALYPEQNQYLYFVSDTDGSMVFAKTEAEHNANAAKLKAAIQNGTSID